MAEGDFSVFAKIQADTTGFEKGMKKAQASANNLSNTFGNLSKVIAQTLSFTGIIVGTKALGDFGKTAVKSGNQATKTLMILDNTVKATGADAWTTTKELEAMAKSLSDETDYSVTELEKMQSVLLGFREITGKNFEEASEAILDMATVMEMDLTSAVQTVGKALDDPIKGLDSLRRQGFAFTNEQKAELAQLVKNGKKLEAQKIILDELARSYGGASKAGQDSFAKQRHAIENFTDTLGVKLLPLVKSFTEDNANALNSLTDLINNVDFNKIGAVIKVSFGTIKDLTKELVNNFRAIGDAFKNSFTGVNFKPVISTLNALLEIITKIGGSVGNRFEAVAESMSKLKDSLANMTANIDFNKLEEAVNIAISAVVFLYNEVSKVFSTLQENVKTFALNFWNSLKSIFEATNKSLADSEGAFKSWGDYLYYTLNNLFKTIQDIIQSVSFLLEGDWQKAWEFAKLAVLRIVDEVLASLDVMSTGFGQRLTNILDIAKTVAGVFGTTGKAIKTAITGIEKLMKKSGEGREGVQKLITETEQKITSLTGDEPDKNLKDLDRFVTGSADLLGNFVDNFKEATGKAKKELDDLSGNFKVTPSPSQVKSELDETFKIVTEWDAKLLQQRLEYLEEHGKDYTDEYHQIQMALIGVEKERALQADTTGAETEKINEYYNKEMEKEDKRFEKAKRKRILDTAKMAISSLKSVAKTAIDVFKKVASTIQNAFTNVAKVIKNTFSKLVGLFAKLFEFSPDDALDSLLKIEDAILTFFVETLPLLPAFFESAFQSVLVLVQTLMNTIDWEKVGNFLNQLIDVFVKNAPTIVKGIVDIFSKIVETVTQIFIESAPEIVKAFGEIFFSIIDALPGMLDNLLNALGKVISELGKYIAENGNKLADSCVAVVQSIVDNLIKFISNGGWKNLLQALLAIQQALEKSVTENIEEIGEAIVSALPDLMEFMKKSIISASKTLAKIAPTLMKVITEIIVTILKVAFDPDVIESSFDVIENVIASLVQSIITLIAELIPVAIKLILNFPKMFAGLVEAVITGIIRGFIEVDWIQVIVDIFTGFVDAFKDFFGIHSPSTLFEGFGTNMVEGLVIGLKGISESVMIILQPFFDLIDSAISNILDGIVQISKVSFDGLNTGLSNTFNFLAEISKVSFNGLNDGLNIIFEGTAKITDAITELVKALTKLVEVVGEISGLGGGGGLGLGNLGLGDLSWKDLLDPMGNLSKIGETWQDDDKSVIEKIGDTALDIIDPTGIKDVVTGDGDFWDKTVDVAKRVFDPLNLFGWWATGTNSAPKGLSIVGEAGPELVNFRGGEQVLNSHNTQKALEGMGGTTINQNVTFNNLQDTTAFAMMQQLKQYNRQMAINGVL